jgi:aryl-alcohol dehydrogenase-like predicted oxidoreductase
MEFRKLGKTGLAVSVIGLGQNTSIDNLETRLSQLSTRPSSAE